MKQQLLLLAFGALTFSASAQNILLVDDNDYITENSDTLIQNLSQTSYSTFDVWNVVSYGATPSSVDLANYDLVIWYASTDGAGLGFWNAGTGGDSELITYLVDGGRAWIIGSDILYGGGYDAPATFSTGDFTYDFMGLTSYDAQSYGDDGNLGVPEMYASDAPAYFPDTLQWIFPTFWWADGVLSRAGSHDMYTMGPVDYPLYLSVSMTHYQDANTNVMSTFFDPALIDTPENRIEFLERSVFYMLDGLGVAENTGGTLSAYPNPATDHVIVTSEKEEPQSFELFSANGKLVQTGELTHGNNTISLNKLENGIYFLHSDNAVLKLVKN
jgi:hypothetical protein